ncbi:MAG TPA: alanine--tRNA ligase [Saprospiraceae bacterium]|nr:alanine--tRNA ligase [Saprospiraceae bacterium]
MMTSQEIRQQFMDFFASKQHKIVSSAPIVSKDDPTLMFTNAGMNQFKDLFLGNQVPDSRRIADTQKCLRVSGKHNDLEEVGRDSYHHTMFEMLGNWSIGDYFKKEAIDFAWELLTDIYQLDKERLYASVFEGDQGLGLPADEEAVALWERYLPKDRILYFDKKDNFWEMGDTGPCGPCSEIHIDLRPDEDRKKQSGRELVNQDHPLVIEIWNLVFIQFNRKADGSLEELPEKHIDTGMGFERLTMAIQGKQSNYETDIFTPFIEKLEKASGKKYTNSYEESAKSDIAMRVISDHIRAVSFAIADGQLPGNSGAGYVIRRILRRAVRYNYSFLDIKEPYLFSLVAMLADRFADVFPELAAQKEQVARIVEGEEKSFLNTLENGLSRFEALETMDKQIDGQDAFELYDTYGFPIDLTRLLAEEKGWTVDEAGFEKALAEQKARSRKDAQKAVGDWNTVCQGDEVEFVGYDELSVPTTQILKYRTVKAKNKEQYQIVLATTPFYAQSGGQAGDTGLLIVGDEKISVLDTQKENDLIIHVVKQLPKDMEASVRAEVRADRRRATSNNHSAVHLMHAALHEIVGEHALQKGQDVDHKRLRFDFSHFQKLTAEEMAKIEDRVNQKIRENIQLEEQRAIPIEKAREAGALMLFGEKYGDLVRMITFDPNFSRELCGGTHVQATGEIGLFKITAETSVAAGIRRIEAITADQAEAFIKRELETLDQVRLLFKTTKDVVRSVSTLQEENKALQKEVEQLLAAQAANLKGDLLKAVEEKGGVNILIQRLPIQDSNAIKNLAYQLDKELGNALIVFAAEVNNKPQIMIVVSRELADSGKYHAGNMVRELAKNIKGGGGGQPFFATAGGKDLSGLDKVIEQAKEMV